MGYKRNTEISDIYETHKFCGHETGENGFSERLDPKKWVEKPEEWWTHFIQGINTMQFREKGTVARVCEFTNVDLKLTQHSKTNVRLRGGAFMFARLK